MAVPMILIADDAAFMRMLLKNTLKQNGFTDIIEAKNGYEAVYLYQSERPDLVLMDIAMPEKDGLQALKEIKNIGKDAKVMMCSSLAQEEIVVESFRLGAEDFVMKPFKPERVVNTISRILKC